MFFPDEYCENVAEINLERLWQLGKRGILCDIDNTLCRDEQFEIEAPSHAFIEKAKKIGFKICIISNNVEKRVAPVAKELGLTYCFRVGKPKPSAYLLSLEKIGVNKNEAVMVGDQLFTDILGAHRLGIYSVLIKPIHKKEILQIRLKRPFEKILLFFYKSH